MKKTFFKTTSIVMLIFASIISAALLQGCEVIYTSGIIIPKNIESPSKDADATKQNERIYAAFDDYCTHKNFQMKPLQDAKSTSESKTNRKMCSAKWFYFAHFEDLQAEYKIELSLMQPWSLWGSGKQERFFCGETNDMFDFFKARLADEKATYKPYANCPQTKAEK